jgi:hypothetical protein
MTPVYRAPMRARDRDVPGAAWGLAHDLVGIGDDDARRIDRFGAAPDGAFVWTRDADGAYWLGQLAGAARPAPENPVGFTVVRPARWQDRPVPDPDVPPAVVQTFARGGRNFQRTHDAYAERHSAARWPS